MLPTEKRSVSATRTKAPKPTLRKLAAQLNISPATVYRALRGNDAVSPDLRRSIITAARTVGYTLHERNTGTVAVLGYLENTSNYLKLFLPPLHKAFIARGLRMVLIDESASEILNDHMFDAVLSLCWEPDRSHTYPRTFSLPVVVLNNFANTMENIHMVSSDNYAGMIMILHKLYTTGHRRIYMLFYSDLTLCMTERLEAFCTFCKEHALPSEGFHSTFGQFDMEQEIDSLLAVGADAVVCAHEGMAPQILRGLNRRGLRVPEDISLAGFEDEICSFLWPSITTIGQDFNTLAQKAVGMVVHALSAKASAQNIRIPYLFFERDSIKTRTPK